jgi:hypothetical protein
VRRPGSRSDPSRGPVALATAALAVAALAAAPALAACGSSGPTDEQRVARTVAAFARATAAKDYAALCERILAPSLIADVTAIGLPCPRALERGLGAVDAPRLALGAIGVQGDRATAEVRTSAANQPPSRDTLRLERVRGSWRIASLTR